MVPQRDAKSGYTFLFVFVAAIFSIQHLIPREASFTLGIIYSIAFGCYAWLCYVDKLNWKLVLGMGLLVRISLFWSIPSLSDDFYRFLWDGNLSNLGVSPYQFIPVDLPSQFTFPQREVLAEHLNSPEYHSVYTPLHQLMFYTSTFFTQDMLFQVNIMRCFFLAGDVLSYTVLKSLMGAKPSRLSGVLFLNPLLILEGVGNLHVEVLVIPLLLLVIYFVKLERFQLSTVPFAFAVGLKLTPMLLLPALAWRFRWKKMTVWMLIFSILCVCLLSPVVLLDGLHQVRASLSLYQQKFEFNASIYYLLRAVGFWFKGYNMIATLGPALSWISVVGIVLFVIWSSRKKLPLPDQLLFSWSIYLLLSTTVHPWYILPLLPLAVVSGYSYPIVWTFTAFFSYFGYHLQGYEPPYLWILAEYVLVYATFIYEINKRYHSHHHRAPFSLPV